MIDQLNVEVRIPDDPQELGALVGSGYACQLMVLATEAWAAVTVFTLRIDFMDDGTVVVYRKPNETQVGLNPVVAVYNWLEQYEPDYQLKMQTQAEFAAAMEGGATH